MQEKFNMIKLENLEPVVQLGPVVQSIVSIISLLRGELVNCGLHIKQTQQTFLSCFCNITF